MNSLSTQSSLYLRNPDVVLREEDPDGGLLFNPDTNRIRVINHTGLFIWKLCDGMHFLDEIIKGIQEAYDEVPVDQVAEQVKGFVDEMVSSGFIGTVEQ
jgi:Coenzyme PQQ synthesis protein D (PqqD)